MKLNVYPFGSAITNDPMIFICGVSRSGTTLLATIIDSHSKASIGYELIPGKIVSLSELESLTKSQLSSCKNDLAYCGRAIRSTGYRDLGTFIIRCQRAGITTESFLEVLREFQDEGIKKITSLYERLYIAWKLMDKRRRLEGTSLYGFKLNNASFDYAYKLFPVAMFVFIIRDPRDVVDSQIQQKFQRTVRDMCFGWKKSLENFEKFMAKHKNKTMLVRYEDLVTKPKEVLSEVFEKIPLQIEKNVFKFYESNASIHKSKHPNTESLKQDFFTTKIGRWKQGLSCEHIIEVENLCKEHMGAYNYE